MIYTESQAAADAVRDILESHGLEAEIHQGNFEVKAWGKIDGARRIRIILHKHGATYCRYRVLLQYWTRSEILCEGHRDSFEDAIPKALREFGFKPLENWTSRRHHVPKPIDADMPIDQSSLLR